MSGFGRPYRAYPLCDQSFCPTSKGGPCRNFAYYSMLIILSWRPKGGGAMPPLNTPLLIGIFIRAYKPAVSTLLLLTFSIFEVGLILDFCPFWIFSIRDLSDSRFCPIRDFVQLGIFFFYIGILSINAL